MKILILSSEFPPGPGGIGNHAYNLADRLQRLDWQVQVVTPQDYASEAEIRWFNEGVGFYIQRIRASKKQPQRSIASISMLLRQMTHFKPDILLTSGMRSVWLGNLLTPLFRIPWIITAHGGIEFWTTSGLRRAINRWTYPHANCIICVSEYTHSEMVKAGIKSNKSAVITNGADEFTIFPIEKETITRWKERNGFENASLLLTVGSVTERKGQEIVIRALPQIRSKAGDVHYLMAGVPVLQNELTALAESLGVNKYVHFLGKVDQETLRLAYNGCDIFVMTSQHSSDGDSEGYGIAVIEAALCGKPAVVSAQSGLKEAVVNHITGVHVPEGSPKETAKAIVDLLRDRNLRTEMGAAAQTRANAEQTWTIKAKEYHEQIIKIINAASEI